MHFYSWIELKGTLFQKSIERDFVGHHAGTWGLGFLFFWVCLGMEVYLLISSPDCIVVCG